MDRKKIKERARRVNQHPPCPGPVVYWMHRDQRADDNHALFFAQQLALEYRQPLMVVFNLVPDFLNASIRHYHFMLKGLEELAAKLARKSIPLILLKASPGKAIPKFVNKYKIGSLVTDFSPLKIKQGWNAAVNNKINIPFYEVDAHNIVPCWIASDKQEYAAYTIRPKINKLLPRFLIEIPGLKKHPFNAIEDLPLQDWKEALTGLKILSQPGVLDDFTPGEKAARKKLKVFLSNKIEEYFTRRNDPTVDFQSGLSPYLHFGQISAGRVALKAQQYDRVIESQEAFLQELIVRRELSDNFCFYNKDYDNFNGFPDWAKKTLDEHRSDPRQYLYHPEQLEGGQTHDDLWNAAQLEMVHTGKMHGYMRMYWAKKILEWSPSPEKAMAEAICLNDRYSLDGRDPNGYTGIAWSIGGVHDRAWNERAIFGKIRFMSYNGCKRKFDVDKYIETVFAMIGR